MKEQPQKKSRSRFKKAIAYAKEALADPELRAVYEKVAAQMHMTPHDMARRDYLNGNNLLTNG